MKEKYAGVPCDPLDGRVDLEERPALIGTRVGRERADAQSDDRDVANRWTRARRAVPCLTEWTSPRG